MKTLERFEKILNKEVPETEQVIDMFRSRVQAGGLFSSARWTTTRLVDGKPIQDAWKTFMILMTNKALRIYETEDQIRRVKTYRFDEMDQVLLKNRDNDIVLKFKPCNDKKITLFIPTTGLNEATIKHTTPAHLLYQTKHAH